MIESARNEDIEAIVKEFQLEPADAYFDRSRRVRSEMIEKFEEIQGRPGAIVNTLRGRSNRCFQRSHVASCWGRWVVRRAC